MHHVCKPKRMLTGLLAVVLAGFFVQAAVAFTADQNNSARAGGGHALRPVAAETTSAKTLLVIPYLSHGIGVDKSLYDGQGSSKTPLVIPYLSHGVGAEQGLYTGTVSHTADAEQSFNDSTTAQAPDAFQRAVNRHEAFVNAMNATAVKSGPDAFQRAVNRHQVAVADMSPTDRAGTLGIGTAAVSQSAAVRPDDRANLGIGFRAVSQSAAVRPDDRVGTRGIGTISGSQSTSSTSSTDWSTVAMAGGAFLGVLLIVAAAVAVSRRQHGRLVTH